MLTAGVQEESGVQLFEFPHSEVGHTSNRAALLRSPTFPEECCVCRTVFREGDSSSLMHSIGREQLTTRHGIWMPICWRGMGPLLSLLVIGVLTTTKQGITAVLISAGLMK